MTVKRYNFKYGPRNKSPLYEDPAGCMVRTTDYDALTARVAELEKDAARMRFLAIGHDESDPYPHLLDGFAGIDLTDQAYTYASALGREVANADDYLAAWRDACDEAMKQPAADRGCQVPPAGWRCTRDAGHDGPCAAVPV